MDEEINVKSRGISPGFYLLDSFISIKVDA
jgi:hypothetical protein